MNPDGRALCLLAGANSIFVGDRLLTIGNSDASADAALMNRGGLQFGPAGPEKD